MIHALLFVPVFLAIAGGNACAFLFIDALVRARKGDTKKSIIRLAFLQVWNSVIDFASIAVSIVQAFAQSYVLILVVAGTLVGSRELILNYPRIVDNVNDWHGTVMNETVRKLVFVVFGIVRSLAAFANAIMMLTARLRYSFLTANKDIDCPLAAPLFSNATTFLAETPLALADYVGRDMFEPSTDADLILPIYAIRNMAITGRDFLQCACVPAVGLVTAYLDTHALDQAANAYINIFLNALVRPPMVLVKTRRTTFMPLIASVRRFVVAIGEVADVVVAAAVRFFYAEKKNTYQRSGRRPCTRSRRRGCNPWHCSTQPSKTPRHSQRDCSRQRQRPR